MKCPEDMAGHPLFDKYPWLVAAASWRRLHFVPGVTFATWNDWWEKDSTPGYEFPEVVTACGLTIKATLPGIFSRMGLKRCAKCCDKLGIPRGNGAPQNDTSLNGLRAEVIA